MSNRSTSPAGLRQLQILLAIGLTAAGLVYIGLGVYRLVLADRWPFACDLGLRWRDAHYLIDGQNPADPVRDIPDVTRPKPGYPPWSHVTAILLVPPVAFGATQIYFAILNLMALGIIGRWAYRLVSRHGPIAGWLAAASALALVSILYCFSNGQYGLVIMGLVLTSFDFAARNQQVLAGLALGLALVKPHIGGLFVLIHLFERRWITVAVCTAYIAGASAMAGIMAKTSPVVMLKQGLSAAGNFSERAQNLVAWGAQSLFGEAPGTLGLTAAGAVVTVVTLLALGRRADLPTKLALCAVVSMFWCYRKQYDCVLLGLVVVAALATAYDLRSRVMAAAYLVMGLSVWLPLRMQWANLLPVQAANAIIWTGTLVLIILYRRRLTEECPARKTAVH